MHAKRTGLGNSMPGARPPCWHSSPQGLILSCVRCRRALSGAVMPGPRINKPRTDRCGARRIKPNSDLSLLASGPADLGLRGLARLAGGPIAERIAELVFPALSIRVHPRAGKRIRV